MNLTDTWPPVAEVAARSAPQELDQDGIHRIRAAFVQSARRALCRSGLLTLVGCGGGQNYELAPVKGQVTCQGKPVPGGTVMLSGRG